MHINAHSDLSSETALAAFQNNRAGTTAAIPQNAGAAPSASTDSALDASLQRLTDLPTGVQDGDWAISSEEQANQALGQATQGIFDNPSLSLVAQGNQIPQNVLQLLQ